MLFLYHFLPLQNKKNCKIHRLYVNVSVLRSLTFLMTKIKIALCSAFIETLFFQKSENTNSQLMIRRYMSDSDRNWYYRLDTINHKCYFYVLSLVRINAALPLYNLRTSTTVNYVSHNKVYASMWICTFKNM